MNMFLVQDFVIIHLFLTDCLIEQHVEAFELFEVEITCGMRSAMLFVSIEFQDPMLMHPD